MLIFDPPFSNGMNASVVIGPADFTHVDRGTSQNLVLFLAGITLDNSNNLAVSDAPCWKTSRKSAPKHGTYSRKTQPDTKLRGLNRLIRPNQREGEMTPCGGVVADMAAVNWLEVEREGPQHFLRTG